MNFFEAAASGRDLRPINDEHKQFKSPWVWFVSLTRDYAERQEWEIKPEETPEPLRLRPSDIGKVVKHANGDVSMLEAYIPAEDLMFRGRFKYDVDGEAVGATPDDNIVEVLGFPHEIDWSEYE